MTKPKWHSKLLSLSIVFALVFSLVATVMPVVAQGYDMEVTVSTADDLYCCCDTFNVTANISNTGALPANNVTPSMVIEGNAEITDGPWPAFFSQIDNGASVEVQWEVHCTGADRVEPTEFIVTATSDDAGSYSGSTEVVQESGFLEATILSPEQGDVYPVCSNFDIVFYVENTGCNNVTSVWAEVETVEGAEIVGGGMGVSVYIGSIAAGERSENKTVEIHCTGVGPAILHVDPLGLDVCSLKEIEGDSAVVEIEQVFGVTCNVTPNPTKEDHVVTFNTTVGEEADTPLDYLWAFGDGNTATNNDSDSHTWGTTHTYTSPGNYTAVCQVTDDNGITVNCTGTVVVVHPTLGVNCGLTSGFANADSRNMTKTDQTVCFTAERVGGLPEGSECYDGSTVAYSWLWEFGDGTNSTMQNPCHTYNTTGNYTATVTLTDDCLLNVATCNLTLEVYDPLELACNATPLETKVGHSVDFDGEIIGGLPSPPVTYNWHWDFDDGCGASGTGQPQTSHTYTTEGSWNAVLTIWDGTAINNSAECNVTILVHPGLNVTCDVTPNPGRVCNAVNFTAERVGGVPGNSYNWTWEFSDGTTAVGQNVTKMFMCIGNYTGTVTVTDNDLGNTANCTVEVEIIIEPPELYKPGNGVTVNSNMVCFEWEDIGCCNYTLEVWQKDGAQAKVWLVETGKDAFWCGPLMDDLYKWQVTATDSCNNSATSEMWYFGVQESAIAVTVSSPNGGEVLSANGTAAITWDAAYTDRYSGGFASSQDDLLVDLSYSADSGATWTDIATGEANDGVYAWTVPMVNSDQCLVMVVVYDALGNDGVDTSDSVFTIEMAVPVASIDLVAGWNLVSLPLIPTNSTIEAVLAGVNATVAYHYDAATATWLVWTPGGGTLTEMVDGLGYWVFAGTAGTMIFDGQPMPDPPALPPTYDVVAGWNMIGVKSETPVHHSAYLMSITGDYSVLYAMDADSGMWIGVYPKEENGGMMVPGHGFWIWMNSAGTIVP